MVTCRNSSITIDHLEHCLTSSVREEERRRQLREVATMLKRYVD
jgi:DNA-binding FrmR family transcriptional regulator